MKKALLIVAMLLSAVPVMAATTITAVNEGVVQTPDGNYMATVRIDYSSSVDIRAFALDINIDSNDGNSPNFQRIRNYKTGESNGAMVGGSSGYGIFPSRFRDFIQVLNGTDINTTPGHGWVDPNYNPTTAWNEPETTNHHWGMGYPQMIVELGTLYAGDPNKPALSGTLFRFDVNNWGVSGTYHVTIAANALRGGTTGVIGSDGNGIAAGFVGTNINFPAPPPTCQTPLNEIGALQAAAVLAWQGQGFTNFNGVGKVDCNDSNVGKVLSYDPTTCVPISTTINYTYGIQPTVPAIVGLTKAQAEAAILAAHLTVGAETGVFSDTVPINQVTVQGPAAGTSVACGSAVTLSYVCRTVHCLNPYCKGDINKDRFVRSSDYAALASLISSYGPPSYRAGITSCLYEPCGDINGDNFVRSNDLSALTAQISGYPAPSYRCSCGAAACPYYSGPLTP